MTGLGTSQRRDADGGSTPERQRNWRLWPPQISWDAGPLAARARGAASSVTPAALWRNHRLFTIAALVSLLPRIVAALGFKPALLIQDSFSYMKQSVQLLPLAELEELGRWLEEFHARSYVELDYGGLGVGLVTGGAGSGSADESAGTAPSGDAGRDSTVEDSVAEVSRGLGELRAGNVEAGVSRLSAVRDRWDEIRAHEHAS